MSSEHCIIDGCPKCAPSVRDATNAEVAIASALVGAPTRKSDRLLDDVTPEHVRDLGGLTEAQIFGLTAPLATRIAETMPVAAAELDEAGDIYEVEQRGPKHELT